MGVFKKKGGYYIDYYFNGTRKREKIGLNRKLAESVLNKRKTEPQTPRESIFVLQ